MHWEPSHVSIDLSVVDKQTALVGMDGRMLAKHSIVLADVLTKFKLNKISSTLLILVFFFFALLFSRKCQENQKHMVLF